MARIILPRGSDVIPVGDYLLRLAAVKEESGQKGSYSVLEFRIDDDSDYKGRKLTLNSSHSDNSLWILKRNLLVLGATPDAVNDPLGFDTQEVYTSLIGNMCTGTVGPNTYTDKTTGETIENTKLKSIKKAAQWG